MLMYLWLVKQHFKVTFTVQSGLSYLRVSMPVHKAADSEHEL